MDKGGDHVTDARPYKRRHQRREEWLLQFVVRQREARKWISFRDIADWCARDPSSGQINEEWRQKAYTELKNSLLLAAFEMSGRSHVHCLSSPGGFFRFNLADARRVARDADFLALMTEAYLQWCWIPRNLARKWFESRKVPLPPHWFTEAEAIAAHNPPLKPSRQPRGTDYRQKDAPLVREGVEGIQKGLFPNAHHAGLALASKAKGATIQSRATRLAKQIKAAPDFETR